MAEETCLSVRKSAQRVRGQKSGSEHQPAGHVHSHPHTKAVLNRMARLIGHLQSIRRMVEEGRDCSDILIQISAVDAAIKNVGKLILKDHMEHCIVEAVQEGNREAVKRLSKAIDQFLH